LGIYCDNLQDLAREKLLQAFQLAERECQFLPTPHELRELAMRPVRVRVSTCSAGCEVCSGSGWIIEGEIGARKAVRCPKYVVVTVPVGQAILQADDTYRLPKPLKALPSGERLTQEESDRLRAEVQAKVNQWVANADMNTCRRKLRGNAHQREQGQLFLAQLCGDESFRAAVAKLKKIR